MLLPKIIKIGLYAILLLPLIVTPFTMFPWQFGKVIFFQIIIEILAFVWLVFWLQTPGRVELRKLNRLDWAVIIFLAILVVTAVTGVNFNNSFFGNQSRAQGVMLWLHFGVFYWLLKSAWREKNDWQRYLKATVIIAVLVGVTAILQNYLPATWRGDLGPRLSGIVGNPAFLAAYIILPAFIALSLVFKSSRALETWFWLGIALLEAVILWGTGIRGVILGAGIGAISVLAMAIFILNKKQRLTAVIILAALLFTGATTIMLARLPKAQEKVPFLTGIANIQNITQASTAQTRLMAWQIAGQGFKNYPLFGIGMGNYEVIFNQYYNPELLRYGFKETIWDKPHNWLLELAVSAGIFGVLAYLAVYAAAVQALVRKARQEITSKDKWAQIILAGGLLAYFIQNLFLFETFNALLIFFIILAFISGRIFSETSTDKILSKKSKFASLILTGVGALILFLLYQYNYLPLRASYYLALSENAGRYQNSPAAWATNAQLSLRTPSYLKLESAVLAASTLDTMSKKNIIKDGQDIKEAALMLTSILADGAKKYPQNYIYPVWAGQAYLVLGEYVDAAYFEQGREFLEQARQIAPRKQEVYFLLGQAYLYQQNAAAAKDILQAAVAISPDLGQPHWFLGLAYEAAGERLKALPELKQGLRLEPDLQTEQNILYLIDILAEAKDYATILDYYKLLSQRQPNEGYWHAKLAATYLAQGDKAMALTEIITAAELDMRLQAEAQKFIRDNNLK